MTASPLLLLTCVGLLTTSAGCSRSTLSVPTPSTVSPADNSYMDLQPGWRLRIVVPQLKSGAFRVSGTARQTDTNTISLSSRELIGYETSYYAVTGKKHGAVRLEFASADINRDGKMLAETSLPTLPFQLPRRAEHIRLIYLVRVSEADHNMAIVASKRLEALNTFTNRLKENPNICNTNSEIFCSWVPVGVAVRPEQQ